MISLNHLIPSPEAIACLDESVARRLRVVPLAVSCECAQQTLLVACENPSDTTLIGRLARQVVEDVSVKAVVCRSDEMAAALDKCYAQSDLWMQLINQGRLELSSLHLMQEQADFIIRLLDSILLCGSRQGASDIHLSPQKQSVQVRFRVDGVLRQFCMIGKSLHSGLLVRIKILASMDIAETRCPQDGQFSQLVDAHDIDFRVSCFPTVSGQNVVLRLLTDQCKLDTLEQLSLPVELHDALASLIQKPDGLMLVCGPTGSGKSTTLHALLNERDALSLNIMTLEDPVERPVDGICQSSIDAKHAMDFSQGVRALLRQDPDVLLIGEIRDAPSCAMALRAAMSGHQVLTTVHARSVLAGLSRLRELGSLSSILANNLVAIASQRLVRKVCQHCEAGGEQCSHCLGSGYVGRQVVLELLIITPALAALIASSATHQELLDCALLEGFIPLQEQGIRLVRQGITTVEELDRVFGQSS
ncbi:putative type II secretion system protein HxcR [Granulosicoccus antarcticus IMCC3135]|uniref:Putative type II secretion system protein HxcR n=2 Tax=Granulosicoccus TaxID=437504 RepID=A0A2Z2P175_9GAMM|nr:putative type II secretion system protein HxcR [Granulosicoccus antarcticus IMCC3135]